MTLLSVVIPALNEEVSIGKVISTLKDMDLGDMNLQLIVVDDGSSDGTHAIARELLDPSGDTLVRHETNRGKGAALTTAQSVVRGSFVLIQDADLEYSPSDIPRLIEPLTSGQADVVYGSRFVSSEVRHVLYFWHAVGNKFLTLLSNIFSNLDLTDMETGYKAFTVATFRSLRLSERGFGVEPEITARIAKMSCRVFEVPISYRGRTYAEGKKIGWRDGFWAIWCIVRYSMVSSTR